LYSPQYGAAYAPAQKFSPRQAGGIIFVVLLHVAIIYALVTGMGAHVVQVLKAPLQAHIIQLQKPPAPPPPPPPPPVIQPPPPYIPPPLVQIAPPPPVPVIAQVTTTKPVTPYKPPPPAVTRAAGLDPNQSCSAPEYPDDAADMGETGTSVLQFLIGTDGSVEQSRIASSSGHDELDQTALRALARCKFRPAVGSDGQPQEAWTSISYVWTLN
jgi:periplasmic protein TonB